MKFELPYKVLKLFDITEEIKLIDSIKNILKKHIKK